MKKKERKISNVFIFAIAFIMMATVFATPDDVSAATSYTSTKVTNVKVVDKTYNSVKLSWKKISGTKKYQVYRATSKNGTYKRIATIKNNYITNKNLTTGKTYYYKIRGYKYVNGKKKYTKYSNKFATYAKLDKPTVSATGSTTSVLVKWTKVAGAHGYQVYRAEKGGEYKRVATFSNETLKAVGTKTYDTKTEPGKKYYYKIRAYREVGGTYKYSDFSTAVSSIRKLQAPTLNYAAGADATRSITLSWSGTPKATKYIVYRYDNKTKKYVKIATTTSTKYKDEKRDYKKTYSYAVRAYRTVNSITSYSAYSNVKSDTLYVPTTKLKVDSVGLHSATVSWTPQIGVNGYIVYAKESGATSYKRVAEINKASTKTATINGLKGNTTYNFAIICSAKQYEDGSPVYSSASPDVSATTKLYAPKPVIKTITDNSITITWDKVRDAESYRILMYDETNSSYKTVDNTTSNSYTISSLESGKEYTFKVRAIAGDFNTLSASVTGTVGETYFDPATTVKNLSASAADTSVTLSWSKVTGAKNYTVEMLNSSGAYTAVTTTTANSYTVTGLKEETSYTFRVRPNSDTNTGSYTTVKATTCNPYTTFHEKKDCYLQYGSAKIWIGQTWNDTVNASLNAAAGGSGAVSYTSKRNTTAGEDKILVYCYDTVDYDEFLMVYVNDGKVVGWMTNRREAGNFEGTKILTNEPGEKYFSLGDAGGYHLVVDTYNEASTNEATEYYNEDIAIGDSVLAGIKFFDLCNGIRTSIKQEEKVAMHVINALRASHDIPPLKYNSTLYGTEDGVGTLAYAKTMAMSNVCSHKSSDLTAGPLAGTSFVKRDELFRKTINNKIAMISENAAGDASTGEIVTWKWYKSVGHKRALLMNVSGLQNYAPPTHMSVAGYEYNGNVYWAFHAASELK